MTRLSKQGERRQRSPRKHQKIAPAQKTGPVKDHLEKGFKEHSNAIASSHADAMFFPKLR